MTAREDALARAGAGVVVNDFVAQVAALARRAAMETLESALSGALPDGRRRGRPPGGGGGAVAAISSGRRPKGAKRPADDSRHAITSAA